VGLSLTTPTFLNAVRTAEIVRGQAPGATIVAGGPHPTAMPAHTAAAGAFDLLVQGEGEGPFEQLLKHLDGDGPALDRIPGLGVIGDGTVALRPPGPPIQDLDSIPLPARHLLAPLSAYSPCPASLRRLPLAHIMTSRGCPSRCNFCDRAVFGERLRQRSVSNVMAEVDQVVARYGARELRFFDDTFTLNRDRLYAICAELRRFSPRIPWTCLTKVNAVDADMLREMRSAGCWQVLYGLESGDEAVLRSLGKGTTVAQNRRAVKLARAAGLRVRADFLVGSPAETAQSLEATMALAKELPIDFAHFNKFVPFPGTTFYEQLAAEGHSFDFSSSSTLDHEALVYVPPGLDRATYQAFLDRCYRAFYFRPRYLARRLTGLRTFTEAWVNARGTLSIGSM
jgi:anaerobic magnesium-protoporphyrin IX monomethyl ester cyclase